MGRRRDSRLAVMLPVRVFGTDTDGRPFTRLAHTVNVSVAGARIGGIHVPLAIGDVVGVQHGSEKCRFRVVWIGQQASTSAGEIGIRSLELSKQIWGVALTSGGADDFQPQAPTLKERRRYPRFACEIGVELKTDTQGETAYARCTDISQGGCYLETWAPVPIDTKIELVANMPNATLRARGIVRTIHPAFGMGVEFTGIQTPEALKTFVKELAGNSSSSISEQNGSLSSTAQEQAIAAHEVVASTAVGVGFARRTSRVLIVEDSKFLKNAYAYWLKRDGDMDVIVADDGEQALEIAATEHPDVIVMDLLMPKMGGVDALRLLKANPLTRDIRVIVISGLTKSNEGKLISEGAFAYLEKGRVGPEQVTEYVKRALQPSTQQINVIPNNLAEEPLWQP